MSDNHKSRHLSELELSAALEGNQLGPAHGRTVRHLAHCSDCRADLLAMQRGLAHLGALPPPVYPHALEEGLSWLQAVVPLPLWALNVLLMAFFHLLLVAVCDLSAVWFRRGPFFLFLDSLPVIWFSSWLLVYWQDLRLLSRRLVAALPGDTAFARSLERDVALCFGWWRVRVRGRQITVSPLISTLLVVLANKLFFGLTQPPIGPEGWKDGIILFYATFANSAAFWTGLASLWFFLQLTRLLANRKGADGIGALCQAADKVLYRYVTTCGVGVTLWLLTTFVKQGWAPGYGELLGVILVALLAAYSYFRQRVFRASQPFRPGWRPQWAAVAAWLAALGSLTSAVALRLL